MHGIPHRRQSERSYACSYFYAYFPEATPTCSTDPGTFPPFMSKEDPFRFFAPNFSGCGVRSVFFPVGIIMSCALLHGLMSPPLSLLLGGFFPPDSVWVRDFTAWTFFDHSELFCAGLWALRTQVSSFPILFSYPFSISLRTNCF